MAGARLTRIFFDESFQNVSSILRRNGHKSLFTSGKPYPEIAEPYPSLKINNIEAGDYAIHCSMHEDVEGHVLTLDLRLKNEESVETIKIKLDDFNPLNKDQGMSESFDRDRNYFSAQLSKWMDTSGAAADNNFLNRFFVLLGEGVTKYNKEVRQNNNNGGNTPTPRPPNRKLN